MRSSHVSLAAGLVVVAILALAVVGLVWLMMQLLHLTGVC